jgi:cell division protein FtsB
MNGNEHTVIVQKGQSGRGILIALSIVLVAVVAFVVYYYIQTSTTIANDNQLISSLQTQTASQQNEIAAYKTQVATLTDENTSYSSQVVALQRDNGSLNTQVASLQSDKSDLQKSVATYASQVTTLQNQNGSLQTQTNTLQTQLTQANAKYDATSKQLALYQDTYGSVVASGVQPNADRMNLVNNAAATMPTWNQLQSFILADKTDKTTYVLDSYDCKDFSRDVHNNAEKAGIRAGVALISFQNEAVGHACDVFKTADKGLVFVDCTGPAAGQNTSISRDRTVAVKIGTDYKPASMFADPGWIVTWLSMGVVKDVRIYW